MTRQVREERFGRPTEGKPICRTGSDPSVGGGGRADVRARRRPGPRASEALERNAWILRLASRVGK